MFCPGYSQYKLAVNSDQEPFKFSFQIKHVLDIITFFFSDQNPKNISYINLASRKSEFTWAKHDFNLYLSRVYS